MLAGGMAVDPHSVTVDLSKTVVEKFIGVGVQWDPYAYQPSPAAWKLTCERLDFMRPALFRIMWGADPYWLGNDASGRPRYAWMESEATADARLQPLYALLDYAESRKIDVMLGEWGPPGGLSGPGDPRWARVIADFVAYLTAKKKYTVIKYYNYMNEPNGHWMWPGGKVDYEAWAAGIRNMRRELDSHGLAGLPITGPDNSWDWDWIDRCARDLRTEIGAWEMHWYAGDHDVTGGGIEKLLAEKRRVLLETDPRAASKPLFMGECGMIDGRCNGDQQPRVKDFVYGVLMADYVAQVARAGWMGAIAWDLDDAMHEVGGHGHPVPPEPLTLKIWGFWNTQGSNMGHPEDEAVRPWYYTWSLMGRLFPKGARIVKAVEGPEAGVRTMAAEWGEGKGRHLSVMLVNDADRSCDITLRVAGAGSRALAVYRYFDKDRPADANGYPVPSATIIPAADLSKGLSVSLPGRGVVFLTTSR